MPIVEKKEHLPNLAEIDPEKIPKHVAIIPDGNRRWAKKLEKKQTTGHKTGADTMLEITNCAVDLNVSYLTFYVFSTENWARSKEEINALLFLLESYLEEQKEGMVERGVFFQTIGNLEKFPQSILRVINDVKEATKHNKKITLTLALNYGGRDDLLRATKKMIQKQLPIDIITENTLREHLDTCFAPDPELIIRTGGEKRLSNFLLYQASYAELFFSPVFWPDFERKHFEEAIIEYQSRARRLGGS